MKNSLKILELYTVIYSNLYLPKKVVKGFRLCSEIVCLQINERVCKELKFVFREMKSCSTYLQKKVRRLRILVRNNLYLGLHINESAHFF